MGYYTDYSLESAHEDFIIPDNVSNKELMEDFFNNRHESELKWYSHHNDMLLMSVANPDVVFHTSGIGEETGDVWESMFLNGKYKVVREQQTMPKFIDVDWE